MPIDASIPLQVRPVQVEDPAQAYGRILSLRNMQMQQQQQQQLGPLQVQQQQAATQEAQIRLQQAQQAQQDQQIVAASLRRVEARARANPAAVFPSESPSTPASSPQDSPIRQAAGGAEKNPVDPTEGLTADSGVTPPPAPPVGPQSGTPTPPDAEQNTLDPTRGLTADAVEPAAPAKPVVPAQTSSAALPKQAASAAPASSDAIRVPHFRLMDVVDDAQRNGLSPMGAYNLRKQAMEDSKAYAGMKEADLKVDLLRDAQLLKRYQGFRALPADVQARDWQKWGQQMFSDGLIKPEDFATMIQQHPKLPDDQTLKAYEIGLMGHVGELKDALTQQQIATSKAAQTASLSTTAKNQAAMPSVEAKNDEAQRSMWGAKLAAQTTAQGYSETLDQMPHKYAVEAERIAPRQQWDANKTPGVVRTWAQNSEQQVRTVEAAARERETELHHREVAALMAQNAATRSLGQNQRVLVPKLASTAFNNLANSESFRDHAPTYQDVIKSVLDQENYADENTNAPAMDENRLAVAQFLGNLEKQGVAIDNLRLSGQRTQQNINKANKPSGIERAQWMADHPGQPYPATTPKAAPPVAPAPKPQGAPPTQGSQSANSPKTYTEADIRAWAKQRGSDPELAVKAAREKQLIP